MWTAFNTNKMNCPECSYKKTVKNGLIKGVQRYKCKSCGYNFTTLETRGRSLETKKLALHMYLEGLGFRSIGRILKVSNVAVLKWIRKMADMIEKIAKEEKADHSKTALIEVMELDEMWHYIGKKNKSSGSGWLLTELPEGSLPGSSALVVKRQGENSGKK